MTPVTRELARKQPAQIVARPAVRTDVVYVDEAPAERPTAHRSVAGGASLFLLKLVAFLLLAFGMAGYLIASMQTV